MSFEREAQLAANLAYEVLAEQGELPPTLVGFTGDRIYRAQFKGPAERINVPLVVATLRAIDADRYAIAYEGSLTTQGTDTETRARDGIFVITADTRVSEVRHYPFERNEEGEVRGISEPRHLTLFSPLTELLSGADIPDAEIDSLRPQVRKLLKGVVTDD
jgi:hypothetical protein